MEINLNKQVAIVTGSSSGIGKGIAISLAKSGAITIVNHSSEHSRPEAEETLKTIEENGGEGFIIQCDVSKEDQVQAMFKTTIEKFGTIDILVNNAGLQHVSPVEEFPTAMFERMIRVMLVGPFLAIKHAAPLLKSQGWGRIVSIASINGLVGFAGKAAYNSAKHGVIGLTKVTALELAAHGVTANAICPGYVDTPLVRNQLRDLAAMRGVTEERVLEEVIYPLVPQRRLLDPQEVADYVAFLASDKARSVTGQAVVMDGGYTAQ